MFLVATYSWSRLYFLFPHEHRWLRNARHLLRQGDPEAAVDLLAAAPPLTGWTASIRAEHLLVRAKLHAGDHAGAHREMLELESEALTDPEQEERATLIAQFYHSVGDTDQFRRMVNPWSTEDVRNSTERTLLQSIALQELGKFADARRCLEDRIDRTADPRELSGLYNNLANLECLARRPSQQLDYLHSAWTQWLQAPDPIGLRDIVHNLAIQSARNGDTEKAQSIVDRAYGLIDTSHLQQVLLWHNLAIEVARETGDPAALHTAYRDFESIRSSLELSNKQEVMLEVTGLRMMYNDGAVEDYSTYPKRVIALLDSIGDLDNSEQIDALIEVAENIRQVHASAAVSTADPDALFSLFEQCEDLILDREPWVEKRLTDLPPTLVNERYRRLRQKRFAEKIRISRANEYPNRTLTRLFAHQREHARICEEKKATLHAIHTWIVICDDFVSYRDQFPSDWKRRLEDQHFDTALSGVNEINRLLEQRNHFLVLKAR